MAGGISSRPRNCIRGHDIQVTHFYDPFVQLQDFQKQRCDSLYELLDEQASFLTRPSPSFRLTYCFA